VIDIHAAARNSTVMEHRDAVQAQTVKRGAKHLLALCALGPRRRGLRVVGERKDQPANPRVRCANLPLPTLVAPKPLAARRLTRFPALDRLTAGASR
jgi:hypothetical protein